MTIPNIGRKRDKPRIQHDANGWQIIYTGFILILLCFFVMLTSFASLEQSKISRFVRAFSSAVSVFSGGRSLEHGATMIDTQDLIVDKEDKMARLFESINALKHQHELHQVTLASTDRGVVMTLADKLLFDSGSARLAPAATPLLHKIGRVIQTVNVPVEIEGHTDDVPIRTEAYPSNWKLSTARAVTVLRFLIEQHQVSARQLSAVGFSSYHPAAPNDTDENRSINRRVEIVFKVT